MPAPAPASPSVCCLPISVPTLTPAPGSPGVPRPFTSWVVSSEPTVASWSPQDAGFSDLQALLLPFPGRDGGRLTKRPLQTFSPLCNRPVGPPSVGEPCQQSFSCVVCAPRTSLDLRVSLFTRVLCEGVSPCFLKETNAKVLRGSGRAGDAAGTRKNVLRREGTRPPGHLRH